MDFLEIYKNKGLKISNYFFIDDIIIGKGSYKQLNFGIDIQSGIAVAIKKQIYDKMNDYLDYEANILKGLESINIFPKFYDQIYENGEIYLIQSIEEPNLDKLWNFCNNCKKLDILMVYSFGIKILIN